MFGSEFCNFPYWWLFPLAMIILCFLVMRGRRGSMMCGFGSHGTDGHKISDSDSAIEILGKRYALGEIDKQEYEEKDEKGKAKGTDFAFAFKPCKEMFEGIKKCCPEQNDSPDCSTMMEQMMKSMMEICSGTKTENQNSNES